MVRRINSHVDTQDMLELEDMEKLATQLAKLRGSTLSLADQEQLNQNLCDIHATVEALLFNATHRRVDPHPLSRKVFDGLLDVRVALCPDVGKSDRQADVRRQQISRIRRARDVLLEAMIDGASGLSDDERDSLKEWGNIRFGLLEQPDENE